MPAWVDSASEARGGSNADLHTSAGGDMQVAAAVAVPGIDTAAAHSSTQAQGEGEEMTAGHSAEQIPVAVETAENTEHMEEVHKTAKSMESATEVREPLSADRPHSTQSEDVIGENHKFA